MSVIDFPPAATKKAKRQRPRAPQRWTFSHVLPFVLALFAVIFVLAGLRERAAQSPVLVAARQIPAGATIDAGDTRTIKMAASDARALAGLIAPAQLTRGLTAATAIAPGEPIIGTQTRSAAAGEAGLGSMSLPIPVNRADGGAITVGDRADVISGSTTGASYVAQGLTVLAVSAPRTTGVLAGSATDYWITVAVDHQTALRLAAALAASSTSSSNALEVVRSTGETATANQTYTPPTSPTTAANGSGG